MQVCEKQHWADLAGEFSLKRHRDFALNNDESQTENDVEFSGEFSLKRYRGAGGVVRLHSGAARLLQYGPHWADVWEDQIRREGEWGFCYY